MANSMEKVRLLSALMNTITKDSIVIKQYYRAGVETFIGGEIVFANATKAEHYDLDMESICGKTDDELMLPEDAEKALKSDTWVLRNQKALEDQRDIITRKDGTVVILSVTKSLLKSYNDNVFYILCIARDVTDHEKEHEIAENWKIFILNEILIPLLNLRADFPSVGVGHELEMLVLNIQKKLKMN